MKPIEKAALPSHQAPQRKLAAPVAAKSEIRGGLVCFGVVLLIIAVPLIVQWRSWHNDELRLEWPMRDGSVLSIRAPRKLMNNRFQLAYVSGDTALEFEKLSGPKIFKGDDFWRGHGPLVLDFPDQTRRGQARHIQEYVAKQQRIYGYPAAAGLLGGMLLLGVGIFKRRPVIEHIPGAK